MCFVGNQLLEMPKVVVTKDGRHLFWIWLNYEIMELNSFKFLWARKIDHIQIVGPTRNALHQTLYHTLCPTLETNWSVRPLHFRIKSQSSASKNGGSGRVRHFWQDPRRMVKVWVQPSSTAMQARHVSHSKQLQPGGRIQKRVEIYTGAKAEGLTKSSVLCSTRFLKCVTTENIYPPPLFNRIHLVSPALQTNSFLKIAKLCYSSLRAGSRTSEMMYLNS